jgi:hypothetical protein
MNKLINQKDDTCSICGDEIPKGAWAYVNNFDEIICEECEAMGMVVYKNVPDDRL